jgi:hypothetical protein
MNPNESSPLFSTEGMFDPRRPALMDLSMQDCSEGALYSLARSGATLVVIQMDSCPAFWNDALFAEALGKELLKQRIGTEWLGQFTRSELEPKIRHFFYLTTSELPNGLRFLKAGLEKRGLLNCAVIGYFDAIVPEWKTFDTGAATSTPTPPAGAQGAQHKFQIITKDNSSTKLT